MNTRKAITALQVVIGVLALAAAGWIAFKLIGYNQAQQIYRDIEAAYASEVESPPSAGDATAAPDTAASPIDFTSLQEQYPGIVAWLKMDDVDISYPIVQGPDNDYYLSHDPSDQDNIAGSVFADYRTKSLDTDLHAIVYGHNMRDESMFGQLDNYTSEDFYKRGTGSFTLYTPKGTYRYKIFAANIVDPADDTYQVGFNNTQVFGAFVKQLKDNSMYDTGVDVAGSDYVVTLSTCSDTNRLVLSAKRM